ncbi:MAG: hypothetical protein ACRD0Z_01570 [Acidimicrobiales bacterium]
MLDTPPYDIDTSVDEPALDQVLVDEVRQERDDTRRCDLESLTATYRLRRGRRQTRLESSRAIFVTTNSSLARASAIFFREQGEAQTVPICALDHELATVAWLKRPVSAPDLPRKQILADCYAALQPSDELWRKFMVEAERLYSDETLTEEDYFTLRFSVDARRALMDRTLGDPDAFSLGTVEEVLQRARENQHAELRAQLREARAARAESAARADSALEAEASARVKHASEVAALRAAQTGKVERVADVTARWTGRAVFAAGVVLILTAGVLALPRPFPDVIEGASRIAAWIVAVVLLLALAVTALHVSIGVSISDLAATMHRRTALRLRQVLLRWFGPEDVSTVAPGELDPGPGASTK